MDFNELIINGQLKEAIEKAYELGANRNDCILIQARLTQLEREKRMGGLSNEDYSLRHNKIVISIMDLIPYSEKNKIEISKPNESTMQRFFPKKAIAQFIKLNYATYPEKTEKAKEILGKMSEYETEELLYHGNRFDHNNERHAEICAEWDTLFDETRNEVIAGVEKQVIQVRELILSGKHEDIAKACGIMKMMEPGQGKWGDMEMSMNSGAATDFIVKMVKTEINSALSKY